MAHGQVEAAIDLLMSGAFAPSGPSFGAPSSHSKPAAASAHPSSPSTARPEDIQQLVDMGFTTEQAEQALAISVRFSVWMVFAFIFPFGEVFLSSLFFLEQQRGDGGGYPFLAMTLYLTELFVRPCLKFWFSTLP